MHLCTPYSGAKASREELSSVIFFNLAGLCLLRYVLLVLKFNLLN